MIPQIKPAHGKTDRFYSNSQSLEDVMFPWSSLGGIEKSNTGKARGFRAPERPWVNPWRKVWL
jgi:hypothetical protein